MSWRKMMVKKNQKVIDEIADFLLTNIGLDENGRGHPTKIRLQCTDLEEAIQLAESEGLPEGLKPYHVKSTYHVWENESYVDEVLVKKVNQLLEQQYNGNLVDLITNTNQKELLLSPLVDKLNGKEIEVSMGSIANKSNNSLFEMICKYIELQGLEKDFWGIRPYHLKVTSMGTLDDQKNVDELLTKKVNQLLEQQYNGNLVDLITNTGLSELLSPLIDNLNGKEIEVSMKSIGHGYFNGSPFEMISRYIELQGLEEEFLEVKPYHLKRARIKTLDGQEVIDEILTKKMDQVLTQKYNGNLVDLITNTNQNELLSPLIDNLNGKEIEVSMGVVGHHINNNTFEMICKYIELQGLEKDFWGIRPYHMNVTSSGTFDDQRIVDEILAKKIDQLLEQKYGGDLVNLIVNTNQEELRTPLVDRLNGREIEVSMGVTLNKFKSSPFEMISRYIELQGLEEEFLEVKPYHLSTAGQGTYDDQKNVDEVLVKKIDQLLTQKYNGNLVDLITNTNQKELLLSPLVDKLNGKEIEVSMGVVGHHLNDNLFEMICKYIELQGLEKDFWGIRPYHLKVASMGTLDDQENVDELLTKKIDQLLTQKYNGKLIDLITNTDANELMSPLIDKLNGKEVEVQYILISF